MVIEKPPDACKLALLKTVEFTEIQGQQMNYAPAKERSLFNFGQPGTSYNVSRTENNEYTKTPIVLVTNRTTDIIRFVRKEQVFLCHTKVYKTNYDHFYVSEEVV